MEIIDEVAEFTPEQLEVLKKLKLASPKSYCVTATNAIRKLENNE